MSSLVILLSVFNNEKTIEKCLVSIKNQTFTNWKAYVIDDASVDNSYHIPIIIEDDFLDEQDFIDIKKQFGNKSLIDESILFDDMLHDIARNKLYDHRLQLKNHINNQRCNHSDNPDDCFWNVLFVNHIPGTIKEEHRDSSWKLLSSVLYISDKGNGTTFVDNNNEKQIEWKPNRIVSFIPSENSWHKYSNTLQSDRLTILFNYGNRVSVDKII